MTFLVLVILHIWKGESYWLNSDGVYLLTSRMLLADKGLYSDIAVAQPPFVFWFGAGVLAFHDSLEWVRFAVGGIQAGGAFAASLCVWRLTRNKILAGITGPIALLTPLAVHEHGHLTPDVLAGPFLLSGVLLAGLDRRWSNALAVVLAVCVVFLKVPLVLPALIIVAFAVRSDWFSAAIFLTATVIFLTVSARSFGGMNLWNNVVVAQTQIPRSLHHRGWGQIFWLIVAPISLSTLAFAFSRHARDQRLMRILLFVALTTTALTFLSCMKFGTWLNVLVTPESVLLPLMILGIYWSVKEFHEKKAFSTISAAMVGVFFAFLMCAQSVSLFASAKNPVVFLRPGSHGEGIMNLSDAEVKAAVQQVKAQCPANLPYRGTAFLAFLARRSPPGMQPDRFITVQARIHHKRLQRVADDWNRSCDIVDLAQTSTR